MDFYKQVFENNKQWMSKEIAADGEYFKRMAEGQTPEILYIGCSDSRVQPENFMGARPGELFVYRNVANMVPNNDISSLSVIQYAVEHLKVKRIVVCGHYGCGGVQASVSHRNFGETNIWIRNIQDTVRLHKDELMAIADPEQRHRRLVELNVREQCLNVLKMSFVQKGVFTDGTLSVHGWVYDLETGSVHDLEINIDSMAKDLETYRFLAKEAVL